MKPFTTFAVVVLILIAALNALPLAFGWSVRISDVEIPVWVSLLILLIATVLGFGAWPERRATKDDQITRDTLVSLLNQNQEVRIPLWLLDSAFLAPRGTSGDEQMLKTIGEVAAVRGHRVTIRANAPRSPDVIEFRIPDV